jgi:UDP-N-acetylglucosamine transferase subunit ALG13
LIFLTVGNWHKGFDRLVEAVDALKLERIIQDDVVAQIGPGQYRPVEMQAMDFCSPTEFTEIMREAQLVITHAGIGTVGQAVVLGKPVIVVPRKPDLGEIGDNHQWTTAKQLEREGKVLVAYETSELPKKLQEATEFVPAKEEGGQQIVALVDSFVAEVAKQRCRQ